MLTGYWIAQAVYVAAKLGIADLLHDGPKDCHELAAATSSHAPSLYRLLRMLASQGVFQEDDQNRFALTPLADCLRAAAPHSQRAVALMMGEEHYRAWGDLMHSIQTGECAFEHAYGQNIFDYLASHPEQGRVFDAAMTGIHGRESAAMLDVYDFSDVRTLADVGGGNGSLLAATLARYPHLQGLLFDMPRVIELARANLQAAGVGQRSRVVGGSFFEEIPSGADAYLLRHIIHDWDDERSTVILKNCRRAMSKGARLLLVESVIPVGNDPSFGKLLDLNMLVMPGGAERTEQEYRQLLQGADFELARIVPTRADVDVIECRAV